MDENAAPNATDDADPSPFRRFPYVQLVLCVACLAMAAWTWMRRGERLSPQRHREHRGRREYGVAVLRDLSVSVVRFVVDGLVVGAMGAFVFGLYLRTWVRARRRPLTAEGAEVAEGSS